eukprot:GFYU01046637.1.p1 GENE.GFYU01046637.1~~GFYU01046637.1.p1  ORF type:complete len:120 (+),score=42.58 GFYU01046637.1:36-362(+)
MSNAWEQLGEVPEVARVLTTCKAFIAARDKCVTQNGPEKCVTETTNEELCTMNAICPKEFPNLVNCLQDNNGDPTKCEKQAEIFDNCIMQFRTKILETYKYKDTSVEK